MDIVDNIIIPIFAGFFAVSGWLLAQYPSQEDMEKAHVTYAKYLLYVGVVIATMYMLELLVLLFT